MLAIRIFMLIHTSKSLKYFFHFFDFNLHFYAHKYFFAFFLCKIPEIIFFIFCFQSGFLCSEIFAFFFYKIPEMFFSFFSLNIKFFLPKDFFILRCYHKFSHRNIFLSICDMCKNPQSFFFLHKDFFQKS